MQQGFDLQQAREFAGQLFGLYRGGMLAYMVKIGYRIGLWEALARGPATSTELAERAGLQERYVREWLGSVTSGGIVEYDPASGAYTLPPERAACLTGNSALNVAPASVVVTHLGKHLERIEEVFRQGGGVPYEAYRPEFTEAMDDSWRRIYDTLLIDGFLSKAPGLQDRLQQGLRVADVGCGTGHAVNVMAREYPRSTFVGYDIAEDAIARARAEATAWELPNVRFEVQDVARLPTEPPFDLITVFDAIHDQVAPAVVLRRIYDALAPDGTLFMVDFKASSNLEDNVGDPFAPFYYAVSVLHCMTVSLAHDGAGLGTMWGRQVACRMLKEAGFAEVQVLDSPRPQNSIYLCRKM